MYYPINKENRSTGFLMPTYGNSTIRGQTLNNAFFWAINRSQDATVYHDWYSKTGQSLGGEYRYIAGRRARRELKTSLPERARRRRTSSPTGPTIDVSRRTQLSGDGRRHGSSCRLAPARSPASANYFSSLVAQQRYQQDIFDATNRIADLRRQPRGQLGRAVDQRHGRPIETFTNDTDSNVLRVEAEDHLQPQRKDDRQAAGLFRREHRVRHADPDRKTAASW